jgi:hypothetical protein
MACFRHSTICGVCFVSRKEEETMNTKNEINEIVLQIFPGGFAGKAAPWETIKKKLISVLPKLPVTKVIMGWSPDSEIYEKTAELLGKKDIEFYLWFPVFSETGLLKNLKPLVDFRGKQIEKNETGAGEDFSFCCPNTEYYGTK